jgi:hypothetical protein
VARLGVAAVLSAVCIALSASGSARAAPADEAKIRCQTAYEHAQQLRRDGRLSASRVELRVCKETCPATLTPDCDRWLAEIATLLPTIRVRARSPQGERLRDVRVLVDGTLLADPATDEPLVVDPGERVLRFERTGSAPVEVRIALEPGERDHAVDVTIAAAAAAAAPPPRDRDRPAVDTPASAQSRVPSYIFGVTGGSALVVAGVLAIKGHVDRGELSDSCAPACDPARVSEIRTLWWASAITAGAGVVSLSLAVLLWPRASASHARAVVRPELVPLLGGMALRAQFR